jgi:hypothetical protein
MLWVISFVLFIVWFVGTALLGKGGFIHILILCAVATALVQLVANYRAARG